VAEPIQREPLALTARIGGTTRTVELLELGGHAYRITVDGVQHLVDARMLHPGSFSLLIDNRSYALDVRSDGDRHRVDLGGRTLEVLLIDTLRHGGVPISAEDEGGPQEIRAMMPGKIVTVLAAVGDNVEKGQGVLVVEAMKMENELKAAAGGVVREILVQPGQAVEAGELLARLE
jgi:acetyl/propionyl-CoA carboxylase alpha subunit